MRPNRKEPESAPFWFQSLIASKSRSYSNFLSPGIVSTTQPCHN